MHNIGTVPTFKKHNVGTVPTYKMYNIGTAPTFKMHNIGTLVFFNLRLGASRPRSVGLSVCRSVLQKLQQKLQNFKKHYKPLQNIEIRSFCTVPPFRREDSPGSLHPFFDLSRLSLFPDSSPPSSIRWVWSALIKSFFCNKLFKAPKLVIWWCHSVSFGPFKHSFLPLPCLRQIVNQTNLDRNMP